MYKKAWCTCKVVVVVVLFAHLNLLIFCCSPSPLQKLPIVVIQKFFYHGNVTSHFFSLLTCNLFTHGLNVSVCSRSNWNLRRGGKPMMNLEKKLSERGGEQTTNSTHIMASTAGCVSALTTAPPLRPIKSIKTINSVACEQAFGGLPGEVTREPHVKGDAIVKGEERKWLRWSLARFLAVGFAYYNWSY